MKAIFVLLSVLIISTAIRAQSPIMEVPVGSSDTLIVPINDAEDNGQTLVHIKLQNGSAFKLGDDSIQILQVDQMLRFKVLFVPPAEGVFRDTLTITMKGISRDVPLEGKGLAAGVEESKSYKIYFYPNPASEQITFTEPVFSVVLFDLLGNQVRSASNVEILNIRDLSPGRFLLRTSSDSRNWSAPQSLIVW